MFSSPSKTVVAVVLVSMCAVALVWSLDTQEVLASNEGVCDTGASLIDFDEIEFAQVLPPVSEQSVDEVHFDSRYDCERHDKTVPRFGTHCQYRNVYDRYGVHVDTVKRCERNIFLGFRLIVTWTCDWVPHSHSQLISTGS